MKIENSFPKYHKIKSIYKRNMDRPKKEFIEGEFTCPEFEYLKDNEWEFTEKVDGTNVRVLWDGEDFRFGGRTDKAEMPVMLLDELKVMFEVWRFNCCFEVNRRQFDKRERVEGILVTTKRKAIDKNNSVMLYGEGYGGNIQSGGKYSVKPSFVLFDVRIGSFWLKRESVVWMSEQLNLPVVPVIGQGTLQDAVDMAKAGIKSAWGDFEAEGLIAKPRGGILARNGDRIITKVKCKDFI